MAGLDVDTTDPREQRNFGLVMAGAFAVLGMIRWGLHWYRSGHVPEALPIGFFAVSAAFLVLGLFAPAVLRPLFTVWMAFARMMNFLVTRILLTVVFFITLAPGHGIIKLLGKDLLKRRWDPQAESYWEEPEEQPEEFDRYLNQF